MIINKIRTLIKATADGEIKNFGFEYEFSKGLNIITGDNSSGKSTILACIYYCLGLEQLIGSRGINALSPALHQALNYKNKSYSIIESKAILDFTCTNGNKYTISRVIKDEDSNQNEIVINRNSKIFSKFIHSERDHGDHGFYKWLADVNNLDICRVEVANSDKTRPLYMQYIFALSFIEQTKGWSDIFSMLPSFGIKEPKQKIVEYALGLESLRVNMALDQIKQEKEVVRAEWSRKTYDFERSAQRLQLYISNINNKRPPTSESKINSFYTFELDKSSKEIKLEKIISNLDQSINISLREIDSIINSKKEPKELISQREIIQESILKYTSEHDEINELYLEEKAKLSEYKLALLDCEKDIQGFKDVRKVSFDRSWEKISKSTCPVCESTIDNYKDRKLSAKNIDSSLLFLESKRDTYKKYISASEKVVQRCISALSFYRKKISLKREQLNSISIDLTSPKSEALRSKYEKLAELKFRINELNDFSEFQNNFKNDLKEVRNKYILLDQEEKRLKNQKSADEEKIKTFKNKFIKYLDRFGYRSNGVGNITIKDDSSQRLLPIVHIESQQPQYIRYVSSASDFVRSIWSYYIALLELAEKHPGFLVMDEPGQHQMRVDSMKVLLKLSATLGKQFILAISQDRNYDSKNVNIDELVNDISDQSYTLHHIDDDQSCITII